MVQDKDISEIEDEYELIPHKEIVELKDELKKLHDNPPTPNKHLQISMDDLAKKIDNLVNVFEKAMHTMTEDEGGATFKERMQPILHRMDKVLEQNAQIADGIVALADLVAELKENSEAHQQHNPGSLSRTMPPPPGSMPSPPGEFPPPPAFPPPPQGSPHPPLSGMPPPPPRKR